MKIAIPSTKKDIRDNISDTFGRAPYFIIADIENNEIKDFKAIENGNANKAGGAGIAAAKLVAENGAEVVIVKSIGPRALDVLNQFKIKVYNKEGIIEEALLGL